jgi:hypothetical protein
VLLDLSRGPALPVRVIPLTGAQALAEDVSTVLPVPTGAPAVAVWWAGLTAAGRASITAGWAVCAGGIDGIPADVREAVNRARLASAVHDAEQAYARSPL